MLPNRMFNWTASSKLRSTIAFRLMPTTLKAKQNTLQATKQPSHTQKKMRGVVGCPVYATHSAHLLSGSCMAE